jgi:hypothetical protein
MKQKVRYIEGHGPKKANVPEYACRLHLALCTPDGLALSGSLLSCRTHGPWPVPIHAQRLHPLPPPALQVMQLTSLMEMTVQDVAVASGGVGARGGKAAVGTRGSGKGGTLTLQVPVAEAAAVFL